VTSRLKRVQTVLRFTLIAAAVAWWGLVGNICWTMPQPDGLGRRMLTFNCPSGLAFITQTEKMALYVLVAVCLVLVGADIVIRAVGRD